VCVGGRGEGRCCSYGSESKKKILAWKLRFLFIKAWNFGQQIVEAQIYLLKLAGFSWI